MWIIFKICMFITSFLPLSIIYIIEYIFSIVNNTSNLTFFNTYDFISSSIFIGALTLASLYSTIYMVSFLKKKEKESLSEVKIIEVHKNNKIIIEFLLTCVLPLIAFNVCTLEGCIMFSIFFSFLMFICISNDYFYANIIFDLCKYHFYNATIITSSGSKKQVLLIGKFKNTQVSNNDNIGIYDFKSDTYLGYLRRK